MTDGTFVRIVSGAWAGHRGIFRGLADRDPNVAIVTLERESARGYYGQRASVTTIASYYVALTDMEVIG